MDGDVVTVEYGGKEFEACRKACRSYRNIKAIVKGGPGMFDAFDAMFCGRGDEYAEILGDDLEEVANLAGAAIAAVQAKN